MQIHTYTHMHTHTLSFTHTHTHTHTQTHTHTHAHTALYQGHCIYKQSGIQLLTYMEFICRQMCTKRRVFV